jgi:hypothetical protein
MELKNIKIILPEGEFKVNAQHFDSSDEKTIKEIYLDWIKLSQRLKSYGGRGINLPEVLSESIFCIAMNAVRINENIGGANTSFDVYHTGKKSRIQVKACSVLPDLTSFGPDSVWDELYFLDFHNEGEFNGKIDIYKIENELIYNHKVNSSQTMKDQQNQGKRPRFSIYKEIILKKSIKPILTYQIK